MTTKQMAEAAGVSVDTIARKAKELFPAKMEARKKTVFAEKEAIEIMKAVRKKNMVELPQNASELPQNAEDVNLTAAFRFMAEAFNRMTKTSEDHAARLSRLEETTKARAALLPPPQINPKARVNMVLRSYVAKSGESYSDAWGRLYKEFSYRTNTNPRTCAANRSMSIIDYIETEGQIDILESVALDLFGAV